MPIIFKILLTIAFVFYVASFPDSKYDKRLFGAACAITGLAVVLAGWIYL